MIDEWWSKEVEANTMAKPETFKDLYKGKIDDKETPSTASANVYHIMNNDNKNNK